MTTDEGKMEDTVSLLLLAGGQQPVEREEEMDVVAVSPAKVDGQGPAQTLTHTSLKHDCNRNKRALLTR